MKFIILALLNGLCAGLNLSDGSIVLGVANIIMGLLLITAFNILEKLEEVE